MYQKKIKKKKALTTIIVLLPVVIVLVFVFLQWNNILAFTTGIRYSESELQEKVIKNDKEASEILDRISVGIRDLNEEEKARLSSGELSEQEAVALIVGQSEAKVNVTSLQESEKGEVSLNAAQETQNGSTEEIPVSAAEDTSVSQGSINRIKELVASVYVLRTTYVSLLDNMMNQAIAEFNSLPANERNQSNKMNIVMHYVDKASALEKECDASMDDLIAELEPLIAETGGDPAVIQKLRYTYAREKSLRKSYYISMYKD